MPKTAMVFNSDQISVSFGAQFLERSTGVHVF